MKVLVNDYGGYAFIRQLSTEFARRGHAVTHSFCLSHTSTPHGYTSELISGDDVDFWPIELRRPVDKYSLVKRRQQEIEYGNLLGRKLESESFDFVVSANMPLDAQKILWRAATRIRARKVFWFQDAIGIATQKILSKKYGLVGRFVGAYYKRLERQLLAQSDKVIAISSNLADTCQSIYGIDSSRIATIPNWAPYSEVAVPTGSNLGAKQFTFLYSGTLSLKHNPKLLLQLAQAVEPFGGLVSVRSQGVGADWLKTQKQQSEQTNLLVEGYVPYSDLPNALAAADVLVALLEPDAALYSVPSKVWTYFCAGKGMLLAIPGENPAARIVVDNKAGLVSDPHDEIGFIENAVRLIREERLAEELGANASQYAKREFEIGKIGSRFEEVLIKIASKSMRATSFLGTAS